MRGRLAIRWTVGNVSERGFEALRLSTWGAWRTFGPHASYAVCVNTVPLERARALAGPVPPQTTWRAVTRAEIPSFLSERLAPNMAEGVAWKFAPLRLFPDHLELSLDNDCILWSVPPALERWRASGDRETCLMAEDVQRCLGRFEDLSGPVPINSGLRGLPPGFDLAGARERVLALRSGLLSSELDEQGLQAAALSLRRPLVTIPVEDVAICSPFPPHHQWLGKHGAHFVGLNARALPWSWQGRGATAWTAELWNDLRPALEQRVGLVSDRDLGSSPSAQ